MKVIKTASGKSKIKISRKEWTDIGKQAGWMGEGEYEDLLKDYSPENKKHYTEKRFQSNDGRMLSYMDVEALEDPDWASAEDQIRLQQLWDAGKIQEYLSLYESI